MNILAKRIERIRRDTGLTQEQFAEAIGAHRSSASRWEKGVSEPKARHLVKIAQLAGITVDQLLAGLHDPNLTRGAA